MKFPRTAKIFRGRPEAAPYAGVFFLLLLFVLLSSLVYTPGVKITLPGFPDADLPGTDQPTVAVAVDPYGRFYYKNQQLPAADLRAKLTLAVKEAPAPLTLLVRADKAVKYETLLQLSLLARDAGIKTALLATRPQTAVVAP